eukprot:1158006-Pelagomonas_calceolata.AAC.28
MHMCTDAVTPVDPADSHQTTLFSLHTKDPYAVALHALAVQTCPTIKHACLDGMSSKTVGQVFRVRGPALYSAHPSSLARISKKPIKL